MSLPARRKLSEEAYERLKRRIITGDLPAGEVLAERELAAELGMSRTPLREALMNLVRDRLVVLLTNRGFVVTSPSPREINEIFELRLCLERHVIEQIFEREVPFTTEELRRVAASQREAWHENDTWAFFEANRLLHIEIVRLLGNRKMVEVLAAQHDQMTQSGYRALQRHANLAEALDEHDEIIRALEAHDRARALRAVAEHAANSRRRQYDSG